MNATLAWTPAFERDQVRVACEYLASLPGVRRVWLFGSVAERHSPGPDSDLDLAVEGLPADMHYHAVGQLLLRLDCPVDLVRWEDAGDTLRAEIARFGTLVHGA